jgi:hypothetical protein
VLVCGYLSMLQQFWILAGIACFFEMCTGLVVCILPQHLHVAFAIPRSAVTVSSLKINSQTALSFRAKEKLLEARHFLVNWYC